MKDRLIKNSLRNDIPVLFMPVKENDTFAISFSVHMGPIYEDETTKGYSHFLEHEVFNRTKDFKTKNDFNNFCDDHGLINNAATFDNLTTFYIKGHKLKIQKAIYGLEQICCYPEFKDEDIEEEKTIIHQEIDFHLNEASSYRWTACLQSYFEKGYHDALGTKESLSNINSEALKTYYSKFFKSNNVFITIVGNINLDESLEFLNKSAFAKLTEGLKPEKNVLVHTKKKVYCIEYPTNETVMVNYFYKIPELKPSNNALTTVIYNIIGGLNSSLMNVRIRQEDGLAYINGATKLDLSDNQMMVLIADVNYNCYEKVVKAFEDVINQIINLDSEVMIDRAVENIITRKLLNYESVSHRLTSINKSFCTFGKYIHWKQTERQLRKIKLEDVTNFCKKYLKNPMVCLISDKENLKVIEKGVS